MRRPIVAVAVAALILAAVTVAGFGIAACGSSSGSAATTQAAASGAPGGGQAPDMTGLVTQALDPLVEAGTITSDQESAVVDALSSSGPGQGGQMPSAGATPPSGQPPSGGATPPERCAGLDARSEPDVLDRARRAGERRDHHVGPGDGDHRGDQLRDAAGRPGRSAEHDAVREHHELELHEQSGSAQTC